MLILGRSPFAGVVRAFEEAAPRLFRPMYAQANMGHPSREAGFVLRTNLLSAFGAGGEGAAGYNPTRGKCWLGEG